MDFSIPVALKQELETFAGFCHQQLSIHLADWYRRGEVPRTFLAATAQGGWLDYGMRAGRLVKRSALRNALIMEHLAKLSPGVAVSVLVQADLGLSGLALFGSPQLQQCQGAAAARGDTLVCLGNSEGHAGSDVAAVGMQASREGGGWRLNGSKSYVTNGSISDWALVTAETDPEAGRNRRLSMFLVDLSAPDVRRKKLNKRVWLPSDLTRITLDDMFVPAEYLLGQQGRGLQQVLEIFSRSRIAISALTLGTAVGAFDLALAHGRKRKIFGRPILDHQAKGFEAAHHYARIQAARLALWRACAALDAGEDFSLHASVAKYLTVDAARAVSVWAADLFGAASVMFDHPIHKYPLDAWAASLGEGTQDVQKLIIFRELMKKQGKPAVSPAAV